MGATLHLPLLQPQAIFGDKVSSYPSLLNLLLLILCLLSCLSYDMLDNGESMLPFYDKRAKNGFINRYKIMLRLL